MITAIYTEFQEIQLADGRTLTRKVSTTGFVVWSGENLTGQEVPALETEYQTKIATRKFEIGDEVKWNDPDNGECSGIYKLIDRKTNEGENSVWVLSDDTEVFQHELS